MKNNKRLRCIHRHTIEEHPKCFQKGLIRQNFKNSEELQWYQSPDYRIGYFDIETTADFNADWGTVLTWCIKEKDGEIFSSVITREELLNKTYDKRVVEEFVSKLREFNIIIGYYSTNFDMPFMRTKALHYGLEFPGYGDLYHWDLFYTVKAKLKLSRRSLDNVCDYLNIEGKTPISKEIWMNARYGDEDALRYVLDHNKGDVIITEKLHDKIGFSRKWLKRSV